MTNKELLNVILNPVLEMVVGIRKSSNSEESRKLLEALLAR